jgi:uncharacterized membrane protein
MDKYSIISIFILVILCIWFAGIGTVVFAAKHYPTIDTDNYFVWIDRYVFFIFSSVFIVLHMVMLTWLFRVPLAARRAMQRRDAEYQCQKKSKAAALKAKLASKSLESTFDDRYSPISTLDSLTVTI